MFLSCRGAGAVGLVASRLWKQRPAPSPAAPPGLLPLLIPPPARPVHPAAAAPAASHGAHAAALPRTGRAGGSDAERLHSSCVWIPVPLRCSGKPTYHARAEGQPPVTVSKHVSPKTPFKGSESEICLDLRFLYLSKLNVLPINTLIKVLPSYTTVSQGILPDRPLNTNCELPLKKVFITGPFKVPPAELGLGGTVPRSPKKASSSLR